MVDDDAVISFRDVTKGFGAIRALTSVSLEIRAGEFVAIIGPSGCGKSTLLRLASRLEHPSSGSIVRRTERIGYVFQEPTLMPWRTVRRNVELLAELEGVDRRLRRERADAVLRLVGLDEFADVLPAALSGGMKMRASLARSLLLDPELFLFDEPFGALDQITRHRLNAELMALFTQRPFAALFVTHSVEEAVYLSSRVLVMSARPGRLVDAFEVPFPYPRPNALRYEPAFATLAGRVASSLAEVA
ncbi:MAG: ABC transporter ATP-binding protein [Actinomycetota bacterium]|jgi:NitT/TauT family transport system ATP-binding protein|nr:MAG: ABC transporter ATP-binding protein [Actinomycetota bacterium]